VLGVINMTDAKQKELQLARKAAKDIEKSERAAKIKVGVGFKKKKDYLTTSEGKLAQADKRRSDGWDNKWGFNYKVKGKDTRQLAAIKANTVIGPLTVKDRLKERTGGDVTAVSMDGAVFLAGALTGIMAYTMQMVGYRRNERGNIPDDDDRGRRIMPIDVMTELESNTAFTGFADFLTLDTDKDVVNREAKIEEWRTSSMTDKWDERYAVYDGLTESQQDHLWTMTDDDREEMLANGGKYVKEYFAKREGKLAKAAAKRPKKKKKPRAPKRVKTEKPARTKSQKAASIAKGKATRAAKAKRKAAGIAKGKATRKRNSNKKARR
jgi:hypothetical protein